MIEEIKNTYNISETFYVGSSKGGYAALRFGIEDKGAYIIAGSLQYKLGQFLTENVRREENIRKYVMGRNYNDYDIKYLDSYLGDLLKKYENNNNYLYLHYSIKEYTYENHMKYLLNDLNNLGIDYHSDIAKYDSHPDLALHFPAFLKKTLNEFID